MSNIYSNMEACSPSHHSSSTLGVNQPQKERRLPTVTPRRFNKFFNKHVLKTDPTRRALFPAAAAVNRQDGINSSPLTKDKYCASPSFTRSLKRRKLGHTYPVKTVDCGDFASDPNAGALEKENLSLLSEEDERAAEVLVLEPKIRDQIVYPEHRIQRVDDKGLAGRLLRLNVGSGWARHVYPPSDYQDNTANFYSTPTDCHSYAGHPQFGSRVPFVVAACNTNTLVASADESGTIRLLESGRGKTPAFKDIYLTWRAHENAIIDLSFTQDDSRLASASGDQSIGVTDMVTQTKVNSFRGHAATVKQVRWQPGSANNSVLASASRDGSVSIWDLRCASYSRPVYAVPGKTILPQRADRGRVNCIFAAHIPPRISCYNSRQHAGGSNNGMCDQCIGDSGASVTSLAFLPTGREHLLLTGSEHDASVRIWDIRTRYNQDIYLNCVSLGSTTIPASHNKWRRCGITSLVVSADGARIYASTRDNSVHVYNTSHLTRFSLPERTSKPTRPLRKQPEPGCGPLYSFRHPMMTNTSFYVKCALRPARNGKAEMLAVGGSDSCAMLFPTDEGLMTSRAPKHDRYLAPDTDLLSDGLEVRNATRRKAQDIAAREREAGTDMRISQRGTPLVMGHSREVGCVDWNCEGDLLTMGDDYLVRVWRDGGEKDGTSARSLRTGGVAGGRQWGCGWADVDSGWDDDDAL